MTDLVNTSGADALLAEQAALDQQLNNLLTVKQGHFDRARVMGEQAAIGDVSIIDMGISFLEAVSGGALNVDDATHVYKAYVEGFNAHSATTFHGGKALPVPGTDKAAAASVSMFRNFGKAVPVREGKAFLERVATIRRGVTEPRSVYQSFVSVCRDSSKAFDEAGKPDGDTYTEWFKSTITDEWIAARCAPKPTATKEELDKLFEAVAKAAKLSESSTDWHRIASAMARVVKLVDLAKAGKLNAVGSTLVTGKREDSPTPDAVDAEVGELIAKAAKKASKVRTLDAVN